MSRVLEPYCGTAPSLATLSSSWNFDPVLIVVMIAGLSTLYFVEKNKPAGLVPTLSIVLFVAFISPLCALSSALFSARAIHHILVGSVAAAMIAIVLRNRLTVVIKVPAEVAFLLHTAIYWLWHLPLSYDFALSGTWQYWLMQSGLIFASVWLWTVMISKQISVFAALGLAVGTMVQMGFLAAILTFAPHPIFEAHFLTTQAFGLSPLEDQQLAGLVMWTVGIAPYAIAVIWMVTSRLMAPHPTARR